MKCSEQKLIRLICILFVFILLFFVFSFGTTVAVAQKSISQEESKKPTLFNPDTDNLESFNNPIFIDVNDPNGEIGWKDEYVIGLKKTGNVETQFCVDYYSPIGRDLFLESKKPEWVTKLPDFKYAKQIYFSIPLGDGKKNEIACVIDINELQPGKFNYDLYLDKDGDGDLAEDFIENKDYIDNILVHYNDGSVESYAISFWLRKKEGGYRMVYYRLSGRYGVFKADKKRIQVLVLDDDCNGVFNDACDEIYIDWNFDGKIKCTYQEEKSVCISDIVEFPGASYRIAEIHPAGKKLVLKRDHTLDLAQKLEDLKRSKDKEGFDKTANEFLNVLPDSAKKLNELAWRWVNDEKRFFEGGVIVARKAVALEPNEVNYLDTLAYSELSAGYYDDSIKHFEECIKKGYTDCKIRYATALIKRATLEDVEKGYRILEEEFQYSLKDKFFEEAVGTLKKAPKIKDQALTKRVEDLASRGYKDWKKLNWYKDLASAIQDAEVKNKFIFIDFRTTWCGWCDKLEADTYSHPAVWDKLNELFVLCQLDGDVNRDLANKYGVTGYPYLVISDKKGNALFKSSGYETPSSFYKTFLKPMGKSEGRLVDWWVVGPFDNPDRKGLSVIYSPEKGIDLKAEYDGKKGKVQWKEVKGNSLNGVVDLAQFYTENQESVFYAYTTFNCEKDEKMNLFLGSDDGIKVWLNGVVVHINDVYRIYETDSDCVKLNCKKGKNELLLKITNGVVDVCFSARLSRE